MELQGKVLFIVPVLLACLLIVALISNNKDSTISSGGSFKKSTFFENLSSEETATTSAIDTGNTATLDKNRNTDSACDETERCPLIADCSDKSLAVMGGLDFVNFYTAFKLEDGTYDETQKGVSGIPQISSEYNGYTFNFISEENKQLFDAAPDKYIPQYGGFCAWGMAYETCELGFAWSATCMGPYGSWDHWTIQNEKLYFFWFDTARTNFLTTGVEENIRFADARWLAYYGGNKKFSTSCYATT